MKTFTLSTILALVSATVTYAAPSALQPRQSSEFLTFQGAGPNPPSYTETVATDGSTFTINGGSLAISHIICSGPATCTLFGADGSTTTCSGDETVDVGPPQPQVSGNCEIP